MSWDFPSCGSAGPEGFGNGNLEMFKGDPLKSLAREICQNSLDAHRYDDEPVKIEFEVHTVSNGDFPGIVELNKIIDKCQSYWEDDKNDKTSRFIDKAKSALSTDKLKVLRISDYNTKGLEGAFDTTNHFTPWVGLVKGSAVSVKDSTNAGGSYGIGKNAPFVNSFIQTVFYRTLDTKGVRAVQGVAHLMSFLDDTYDDDNPLRRSVGFYGDDNNQPFEKLESLDAINIRQEAGTDLFIPAFKIDDDWVSSMAAEILDNFLMSLHNGKLEVKIASWVLNKDTISQYIARCDKKVKEAYQFNQVLHATPQELVTEERDFFGKGILRLRLIYRSGMKQKILVVRSSGMKIAEIPNLPRQISFVGILELIGDDINEYFRGMETPQHDKWEPKRHPVDPVDAKNKKDELEKWVKSIIEKKIMENVDNETDLDTFEYFSGEKKGDSSGFGESLIDRETGFYFKQQEKIKSTYKSASGAGKGTTHGFVDPAGEETGFRAPIGGNGGTKKGRPAIVNPLGPDSVRTGKRQIGYSARVIKDTGESDRLIISTTEAIKDALVEIVTMGENGKSLPLYVTDASSEDAIAYCKNGKIYLDSVEAEKRVRIKFRLRNKQNFALGVKVYGNKE